MPPRRKYERGTIARPTLATFFITGRHFSPIDALALLDQLNLKILVATTDAHAKNYSLLLPVGKAPHPAPLYDVLTVLLWPSIVQYFAQNIAGKKRKLGDVAARHWDATAHEIGFRPADVRKRVKELVDDLVANHVAVTEEVAFLAGSTRGYVEEAASLIGTNALRISGRLVE